MVAEVETDASCGALAGVRVLDLSSVVLGPVGTQILADHGADVIKVEPLDGDLMRANGAARNPGMSSIFLAINRNKRSLALDLKVPEGRAVVMDLVARADVLVHNMRVPAITRLGLDYQAVAHVNPAIIYCAATGFGQDGPDRYKPAFDDIIQACCGFAGLMGEATGRPEYAPSLIADKIVGIAVGTAVLAALFHKERRGEGQYIEVPMYETMVEFLMMEHMGGLAFEPPTGPPGYARILHGGRRPCRTADGHIAMLPYNPQQWRAIFKRIDREDVIAQVDFSDRVKLNAVVRVLYQLLDDVAAAYTTDEWLAICAELDVAATRIYSLDELPDHPHARAVGLFQTAEHPTEGTVRFVRPTTLLARSPLSVRTQAPTLGADNEDILTELGYDADRIEALRRLGAISAQAAPRI